MYHIEYTILPFKIVLFLLNRLEISIYYHRNLRWFLFYYGKILMFYDILQSINTKGTFDICNFYKIIQTYFLMDILMVG